MPFWSMIWRQSSAWCAPKFPSRATSSRSILSRMRPLAMSAKTAGSCSPAIIASIIARDGHRPHRRCHRGEFDDRVLEDFLETLDLVGPVVDLGLLVPGQLAELSDVGRGHKGGPHHPRRGHVGQPLGVGEVGLPSRDVLHVLGVAQQPFFEEPLEGVVDRSPVDPRRLHGHGAHAGIHEERCQLGQAPLGGGEPLFGDLDISVGHREPGAAHHIVAVDVETANLVSDLLHCSPPPCRRPPGEDHGVKRNLRFVLVATLGGPHGPAPDLRRARGGKKTSATTPGGHPPAFHPLMVTSQVMGARVRPAAPVLPNY
jgi:hypothetical protein